MPHKQFLGRCCQFLAACAVLQIGAASANNGLTIGAAVTAPQHGVMALDLQASLPLVSFALVDAPVLLTARADVAVPLDVPVAPALGLSVLLEADDGVLRPYIGGGLGASYVSGGSGVLFGGFAYTGLNY